MLDFPQNKENTFIAEKIIRNDRSLHPVKLLFGHKFINQRFQEVLDVGSAVEMVVPSDKHAVSTWKDLISIRIHKMSVVAGHIHHWFPKVYKLFNTFPLIAHSELHFYQLY